MHAHNSISFQRHYIIKIKESLKFINFLESAFQVFERFFSLDHIMKGDSSLWNFCPAWHGHPKAKLKMNGVKVRLASRSLELEFPILFSLEHLELANRDLDT